VDTAESILGGFTTLGPLAFSPNGTTLVDQH